MTDSQWQLIEKTVDNQRKRKYSLRVMVNAILWLTRTGGQWRNLESRYPAWQLVYYSFNSVEERRHPGPGDGPAGEESARAPG